MTHTETMKLVKRFPVLYQDFYSPMTHTCMCWGFSCGDGWKQILWNLSLAIEHELNYTWIQKQFFLFKKYLSKRWNGWIYKISPPRKTDLIGHLVARIVTLILGPDPDPRRLYRSRRWLLGGSIGKLQLGLKFFIWFPYTGFAVDQVKEKYGRLCFYCPSTEAIDKHIALATRLSTIICEQCGAEGEMCEDCCWLMVRCQKCRQPNENPLAAVQDKIGAVIAKTSKRPVRMRSKTQRKSNKAGKRRKKVVRRGSK